MNFLALALKAYGPFEGARLDFSSLPRGLHVIYGRNEAGKSTALRAVRGLLYGIDRNTPDAHRHKPSELRIGATLIDEDGTTLEIVRRKGNVKTLAAPDDTPIEEARLERLLHGVGLAQFTTLFGLDHETLRLGAQALLAGKGNLGESLFEAGVGSGGLHAVLAGLRTEADAIFAPLARNRPLNEALKAFSEAQKRVREQALHPDKWVEQERAIDDARAQLAALETELKQHLEGKSRLERARRALPLVERRRRILADQAALGEVVRLPERAPRDREDAQREAAEADSQVTRLQGELSVLAERRAEQIVPAALLDEHDRLEELRDRKGSHGKAADDLPRLQSELRVIEREVDATLKQLGRSEPPADTERARIVAKKPLVKKLALEEAALVKEARRAAREVRDGAGKLESLRERRQRLPLERDAGALRLAVGQAQRQGGLERELARSDGELERARALAATKLSALGLWTGSLSACAALPVPLSETLLQHDEALAAIARKEARVDEQRRELQQKAGALEVEWKALTGEGAVPTEDELLAARQGRDERWAELKRDFTERRASELEVLMRTADELADRLRREAERVARQARLRAEREQAAAERARLDGEAQANAQARAEADAAWRALWQAVGIEPRSPSEMRAWSARHAQLVALAEELDDKERDARERRALYAAHRSDLSLALAQVGEPTDERETLEARIERAARVLREADDTARLRADLAHAIEAAEDHDRALTSLSAEHEAALAGWTARWGEAMRALGLVESTAPDEATALVDELDGLWKRLDDAAKIRRRIEGIQRDATRFTADLSRLVSEHAPELAALPVGEAAAQLVLRYQDGVTARELRLQYDQQIAEKQQALEEQHERAARARVRLDELLQAAGAEDLPALARAEERSAQARELVQRLAATEEQLLEAGDGKSLAALEAEVGELDVDQLQAELDAVEEKGRELDEARERARRNLLSIELGMPELESGGKAREAAEEAQSALAHARGLVERYVRVKLAQVVLARQIEQYRERNQGPILGRASELFLRLTLGRYSGLKAGFDDQDCAVLRCLRAGQEVEIDALSDGTRDQLYLALRLASLERHTAANPPMPLVVDDILIHFDDERARAALEVLGEVGERMQVLFFTHHLRLVELARGHVPETRFREHVLG